MSYRLLPSRSTDAARTLLGDYTGVAICDGYKAYDVLARERKGSDLTLAQFLGDPKVSLDKNGVEPRAYLREATLRAVRNPGMVTLPRNLRSSES